MEIEHVSVSRVELYRQCPVRYGLRYDLPKEARPPEEDVDYLKRGSAIHETIAIELQYFKDYFEWDMKHIHDTWIKVATKYNLSPSDVKEGKDKLSLWAKRIRWPEHILDIEKRWEYDIDNIPVVFVPDLVEEIFTDDKKILKVTDWKTNIFPYSQDKMDTDLQAPFYLSQMKKKYPGYDEYVFFFDFVYVGTSMQWLGSSDVPDIVEQMMVEYYKIIAEDKSPKATVNEFCGSCPGAIHGLCPILKRVEEGHTDEAISDIAVAVKEGMSSSVDGLDDLVSEDIALSSVEKITKARKDRVRNGIRNIMRDNGLEGCDANTAKISFKPNKRVEYRAVDVMKCVGNNPITLDTILNVNKTALTKAIDAGLIEGEVIASLEASAMISYTSPVLKIYYHKPREAKKKKESKKGNFWE